MEPYEGDFSSEEYWYIESEKKEGKPMPVPKLPAGAETDNEDITASKTGSSRRWPTWQWPIPLQQWDHDSAGVKEEKPWRIYARDLAIVPGIK